MYNIYHDFTDDVFSFHKVMDGYDPGYLHFHSHYELSVVLSGKMTVINNGDTLKYDKPCILLHKPHSFHSIIAEQGVTYDFFVFHFNDAFVLRFSSDLIDIGTLYKRNLSVIPVTEEVEADLFPLLNLFPLNREDNTYQYILLAMILAVTKKYIDASVPIEDNADSGDDAGTTGVKCHYIEQVIRYISENYAQPLSSESIAKQFFISPQKLRADFKQSTLLTLKQYILDVRITNSIKLLSQGNNLIDTAYSCGFINESHFIKTFKARVGISPYQYSKISGSEKN